MPYTVKRKREGRDRHGRRTLIAYWLSGGNNYGVGTDGSDRFVFGGGDGTDTILDFEDGKDILVIKGGLKFSDLAITNNAKGHAVITGYGENDSITLKGVSASILTDSDFIA